MRRVILIHVLPFYVIQGLYFITSIVGPAAAFISGGYILGLYVDIGRVDVEEWVEYTLFDNNTDNSILNSVNISVVCYKIVITKTPV